MTTLTCPAAPGHRSETTTETFRFAVASCARCRGGLFVIDDAERPTCPACRRSGVWAEAHRLLADVRLLQRGLPPFDVLTPGERAEQLAALATDEALLAAVTVPESDGVTREAAQAELVRRFHLDEPTASERAEVEAVAGH